MRTRKGTIPWFKTDARCIECSSVVFVFSCNDNAAFLKNSTDLKKTCKDPLLSASLFQRKWTKMDDDTEFRFEVIGSKEIMIDDHLRSRIVGSIGNL